MNKPNNIISLLYLLISFFVFSVETVRLLNGELKLFHFLQSFAVLESSRTPTVKPKTSLIFDSSRRLHFFFALKRQTTYTGRRQGGCFSMLTSSGNPKEFVSRELIETWKAPVIEPRAHQTPLVTPLLVVPTDHHDDCHNVSSLLPSGLRGCSFIDIKYTMEVSLLGSKCRFLLKQLL